MDETFEPYGLPGEDHHPAIIAERLMRAPVHVHLYDNEVPIGWLMRMGRKDKGGKRELGSVHKTATMCQGGFKDLFGMMLERLLGSLPDFVIVLDAEFWNTATPTQREALVWHELAHIQQLTDKFGAPRFDKDGLPVFGIVEHDITAFRSEVQRFGAWTPDIAGFLDAVRGA